MRDHPALGQLEEVQSWVVLPCQAEPDLYFAERPQAVERAKELCRDCPVRDLCLAGARDRMEPWGVWGGELFVDGEVVAFRRGRGRPRKSVATGADQRLPSEFVSRPPDAISTAGLDAR